MPRAEIRRSRARSRVRVEQLQDTREANARAKGLAPAYSRPRIEGERMETVQKSWYQDPYTWLALLLLAPVLV